MKGEFLLEIGAEEIPAGFMLPALEKLAELFSKRLEESRIGFGQVSTYGTPRRLILSAKDVDFVQASREIEKTGPPRSAAYDKNGNPTKAAIGFALSQGVDVSDLVIVGTPRGEQVAARKVEEGRRTAEVLSEILPSIMERVPFPKTMRWMDLDVRFARPVHWIVALLNGEVIPFTFGNVRSGNLSRGHRFVCPDSFAVSCLKDFCSALEAQGVIIDPESRRAKIEEQVTALAANDGLEVSAPEGLLDEVNFLVESPYSLMGEFHADFLELPASILITCMKKHQRYFAVQDKAGRIRNRFIAVNNTPVRNLRDSVKGHQRVLRARLEDARFYYREDRKVPLMSRLEALKGVVFHSRLGTSYEKVQRFTGLAKDIARLLCPDKLKAVERAALLSKCDLETGIVYEFPELQGIIGSHYAQMDGESEEVSTAVMEHYLPTHAGDRLPSGIVGAVVSIADRIDTIAGCFSVDLVPSGTADPYALRRHALAVIQILIRLDRPLHRRELVNKAIDLLEERRTQDKDQTALDVMDFIRTRFVNFHTSRGYSLDVVEAAARARFDDVVDARKRVDALQQWKRREDFDAITIGFKRVVNILKNTSPSAVNPDLLTEIAEKNLFKAFRDVEGRVGPLIEQGDYANALEILAELRPAIDKLFDEVMVMVEDEKTRNNRLGLLAGVASLFQRIADFSFIGSTA